MAQGQEWLTANCQARSRLAEVRSGNVVYMSDNTGNAEGALAGNATASAADSASVGNQPDHSVRMSAHTPPPEPPRASPLPPPAAPGHPTATTWPQEATAWSHEATAWPPPPPGVLVPPPGVPARRGWRRAVVATVAAGAIALTAGGVGGFVGYALHPDNSPLQATSSKGGNAAAPVVDRSSLASIAASVQPTVVVIETGPGEGSGVIISADGYIVTNNHVVAGARGSSVKVTFNTGKQVQADIVGTDPKTDLAVVKADATGLTYAAWGDSDAVQVGDTVLAIGSPLGLQGSVTAGIVSALHRTITVGGQRSPFDGGAGSTTIGDAIQTDAPINPGNSGGALVDTNGKLIGINSAIATSGSDGNIGVGFAISANRAKAVAEQLTKGGKVSHPYLGVSIGNAPNGGAQIQTVVPGSPADKAGLEVGDVVSKVGDQPIRGSEDLVGAIQRSTVGTQMTLTVVRGGSEQTITATVGEQP
jgi:putative serine protease PepD